MGRLVASFPSTVERPEIEELGPGTGGHWIVTVYDNDYNSFEQVMLVLILATGCTQDEAEMETWEIHHLGSSVVHHAGEAECHEVAAVIKQIGIRVEVTEE